MPTQPGASALPDAEARALRVAAQHLTRLALDSAALTTMQRLALVRELATIRANLLKGVPTLERLKLAKRLAELRVLLGAGAKPADPPPGPPPPSEQEAQVEAIVAGGAERKSTAHLYDYDPNRKPAQRKRENAEAMALLARIDAGDLKAEDLTDEQRAALARYSGTGGNLVGADGKKGSAYEYYTPKPIAEGMWGLLAELGFKGGRVLDPSSGVGIFSGTAPVNAAIDAIELNETSGRVNGLVNDGPGHSTTVAPFEQVAAATPDEVYDAVITNVPFGGVNDRGGNQFKDTKYRDEPLQNYFILRSLEKLRPGGLAAFITPPRVVSGKGGKEEDLRQRVSYVAEFMGAYRLPNSVFGTAQADTITDVIVFRKFDRATLDKVAELREQNPGLLVEANVCWPEFIQGTYFAGEGRRFILGEFVAKDPNKFRDVDRVVNNGSMTDIARLLRKFGDSRIRWDVLEAAETAPIVYREGDTINHAGQTLQMQGGRWVVLKPAGDEQGAADRADLLAKLTTPLGAVNAGVDYATALRLQTAMVESAEALLVPDWLRGLLAQLQKAPVGQRESAWSAAIVGLAIDQAMEERQAEETGFNYLEGYPTLSEAMPRVLADAKRPPTALDVRVKTAMKKVAIHFDKVSGYSGTWRGDVAATVDDRSESQRFEAAKYQAGGGAFAPLAEARAVFGDAFDPMGDDDWCVSADGQGVARADDYYVGNYADFLTRIDADIAAATDPTVRSKLLRQKAGAESRLLRADPGQMEFTLFSPFVKVEERAEFLRRFVDPRFSVGFDEGTGAPGIQIDLVGGPKNVRDKLLKRLAIHLNGGRLTLGGADVGDEKKALAALRDMANTAEAQFNSWVRANPIIMGRIADVANDPARIYFRQVDDESPLDIPGLNSEWASHGYQNAWVRRMGREFGGINGDGVGLGKTSQGLIAVQHAQSIGVKRKTMFVVPNSVLSNWRKEARRVYASIDDCLFVGLREIGDGKFRADPSAYDADLTRVLENKHPKIFLTYEAFQRLRLRATTAEAYDAYLARVDLTYAESDRNADNEKTKSLRAKVIEQLTSDKSKSMAAPYFEDLGVDSLVIDEAHMLKNSRGTVEFKGGKFLSLAEPSARGLDAQAKCWYVRKSAPRKDGVILLTATPITNSPLEIYSMLSLAIGDEKLQDMMVGIKGADQFMEVMCDLENMDEETLDGKLKPYDVFVGLKNVGVLRNALSAACTMRTAEQVGQQIVVPNADELPTPVDLPEPVLTQLQEYKEAFRFAIDTISEKADPGGSEEAFERVAAKFGEPMELIGHPFNLIQKMSLLIADPELDERATFYVISPAQAALAADVVGKWNAKAPVEDRARMGPHTAKEAVVGTKKLKDGDDVTELLRIQVRAKVVGEKVIVDTMNAAVQASFEALADKSGLDLDVTVPPKLAALVANYQKEEANPRGRVSGVASGRVRQLVFCDVLAMHTKIKRLLHKRCGVAAAAIAIITGTVNGKPEEILDVQDGFNAEEGNRFRCVIANEKAEVGINLQKGTQAIHHLTLGWTPDSLTQRNGRGVRQGNETERVTVYHYDADGTFDSYKRMLVGKKSSWIDSVMDPHGGNKVAIATGLTREQMEALIDAVGDRDAMSRIQERAAQAERLQREASTQGKQAVNVQTIKAQQGFLAKYPSALQWAADKIAVYSLLEPQIAVVRDRIANPKATASAVVKNRNLLAELEARQAGMRRLIDESVTFLKEGERISYDKRGPDVPVGVDEFIRNALQYQRARDRRDDMVRDRVLKGWGFKIEVSETSGIGNEWRAEVDQAQAMIDESRHDFERLAGEAGGHSADVLSRIDAGEALVVDGRVLCAGTFIETADGLAVLRMAETGLIAQFVTADGKAQRVAAADAIRGAAKVVLPGAPGYSDLVTKAARIEDKLAEKIKIGPDKLPLLFSYTVPEVGQRRQRDIQVRYQGSGHGGYILPPPYFPYVVSTSAGAGAVVARRVVEQQKAVVQGVEDGSSVLYFLCASTVSVRKEEDQGAAFWPTVIGFAKAEGLRLTVDDYEAFSGGRYGNWERDLLNPERSDLAEATKDADTPDAMERAARAWLAEQAYPQFDLGTIGDFSVLDVLKKADWGASWDYQQRVQKLQAAAAKAALAAAANDPSGVTIGTPTPEPDPAPVLGSDDDLVGVTGDTKRWKDQIKTAAAMSGGRAIWDGDKLCWNVPLKAWKRLIADYPAAEQGLSLIESSGKTSYGGRRRYR